MAAVKVSVMGCVRVFFRAVGRELREMGSPQYWSTLWRYVICPYFGRVVACSSQFINCVFLGGHEDQSLSARAYARRDFSRFWAFAYRKINRVCFLLFKQENHCLDACLRDARAGSQVVTGR